LLSGEEVREGVETGEEGGEGEGKGLEGGEERERRVGAKGKLGEGRERWRRKALPKTKKNYH